MANAKQIEAMKSSVDDSVAAVEEMKKTVAEVERASAEVTTNIEALAKTNIDLALRRGDRLAGCQRVGLTDLLLGVDDHRKVTMRHRT